MWSEIIKAFWDDDFKEGTLPYIIVAAWLTALRYLIAGTVLGVALLVLYRMFGSL